MTWERLLNRNSLGDGDYDTSPVGFRSDVNLDTAEWSDTDKLAIFPFYVESLRRFDQRAKHLAGDIRRLERDVVDEQEICTLIAHRISHQEQISPDTVAAVLKEFLSL